MQESGNFQWDAEYPNIEVFERDIERDQLWVAVSGGQIAAIAAITTEQEPEYVNVGWDISEQPSSFTAWRSILPFADRELRPT